MSITNPETSFNLKFLAFILRDSNELHVWDIQSKARCLVRLKPLDLAGEEVDVKTEITSIKFSPTQEHILAVGLSSGHFAVFDCSKAEKLRAHKVCDTGITSVTFLHDKMHQVVVGSAAKL